MANCGHCCCHHCCHWHHWHHHCQLLDVVHWVAETGGPTLCDLVADGVNVNLKRLSIIDEVNGRLVMVNGGWRSSHWRCYVFMHLEVLQMKLDDFLLLRMFLCGDLASSMVSKVKGVVSM